MVKKLAIENYLDPYKTNLKVADSYPVEMFDMYQRMVDYKLLTPEEFTEKHGYKWDDPFILRWKDKNHYIQANFCTDPFCKWHGHAQKVLDKSTPRHLQKYRLGGSGRGKTSIHCNIDPHNPNGIVTNTSTSVLSNWAVCNEMARLININTVVDVEPEYVFHNQGCSKKYSRPLENPDDFRKRGKSSSNSQKWQCKQCGKITNVIPEEKASSYHKQRDDILVLFAKLLVNRVPVQRACEILEIGVGTYYDKLEELYKRCLIFLEEHETEAFAKKKFEEVFLDTDYLQYNLKNIRRRGMSDKRYDNLEDKKLLVYAVVSGDIPSRYIFRTDLAFDWLMPWFDLETTTVFLKEDHLPYYSRSLEHLQYSYFPQPPSAKDYATAAEEYEEEMRPVERRLPYVEGHKVNETYTSIAHLWLLKQMVKADRWVINSDNASTLSTAILRVFAKEISSGAAEYFITEINVSKRKPQAYYEWLEGIRLLKRWREEYYPRDDLQTVAMKTLTNMLLTHNFFYWNHEEGKKSKKTINSIQHPLPTIDEGYRTIYPLTNVYKYSNEEIARLIVGINNQALKSFFSQIRRRLSIFERPLFTARKDVFSYIYANFNPRYGQYALTILRTYHNFCLPWSKFHYVGSKRVKKDKLTPAQRLGIVSKNRKLFKWQDIIYMK